MAYYVLQVGSYEGDSTARTQLGWSGEDESTPVAALYAIVKVDTGGASIVDDGYRSREEARAAWPEAL